MDTDADFSDNQKGSDSSRPTWGSWHKGTELGPLGEGSPSPYRSSDFTPEPPLSKILRWTWKGSGGYETHPGNGEIALAWESKRSEVNSLLLGKPLHFSGLQFPHYKRDILSSILRIVTRIGDILKIITTSPAMWAAFRKWKFMMMMVVVTTTMTMTTMTMMVTIPITASTSIAASAAVQAGLPQASTSPLICCLCPRFLLC